MGNLFNQKSEQSEHLYCIYKYLYLYCTYKLKQNGLKPMELKQIEMKRAFNSWEIYSIRNQNRFDICTVPKNL